MHGRLPPIYNKNLVLQQSWKVRSTVWNIIKAVTRQLLPLINGLCGVLHALFFLTVLELHGEAQIEFPNAIERV